MPEDVAAASGAEDEKVKNEEPAEAAGSEPTHEPFSYKIFSLVSSRQTLNGLRHNDHLRYRQYCTRKLRRLYVKLQFKHGRARYKAPVFPTDLQDPRYLEIPLVLAERSWGFGMQLKADNAASSVMNCRWRHHSICRFSKAVKWAAQLEAVCKDHCDQRTQLEAEAYVAFLEGTCLVEKETWPAALDKLVRCRRICEQLGLVSEQEEAAIFKAKVQELAPRIRECRYHLGMAYDEEEDENLPRQSGTGRGDLSELSYRGQGLIIPSEKIKSRLVKCLGLAGSISVEGNDDSAAVIEKYGEVSAEFGDALRDIHSDMIAAGAEGQTVEWRMLEAFARELSTGVNVERNVVLLSKHLGKVDSLEEVSSSDSRKFCRPEEGMRFCDLLKEDIENLRELPETSEATSVALTAYLTVVLNCRCFFLALCFTALGKLLEAAALFDMLRSRVEDVELAKALPEPLGRLHKFFEEVQQGMAGRVACWRCRGMAQLCAAPTKQKDDTASGEPPAKKPSAADDFAQLATFPPCFREIPCKPLLFDLAFPCIVAPDIEQLLSLRASESQQKGILGRVAGFGTRLGGLFGRR